MTANKEKISSLPATAKRSIACNFCRTKKVRCNGGTPCTNCLDHRQECVSATKRRVARPKNKDPLSSAIVQRLARVEAMLQAAETTSSSGPQNSGFSSQFQHHSPSLGQAVSSPELCLGAASTLSSNCLPHHHILQQNEGELDAPGCNLNSPVSANGHPFPTIEREDNQAITSLALSSDQLPAYPDHSRLTLQSLMTPASPMSTMMANQTTGLQSEAPPPSYHTKPSQPPTCSPDEKHEINSVYAGETSNWEYHGPRSYLSICSKPGIQWVMERTGNTLFQESSLVLTREVTCRLKIERKLSKERTPEPSPEAARRYTQAYFEGAPDAAFGIIDRYWFENRLHSPTGAASADEDPAWYALRNAVYASGCRIDLSNRATFREAYQTGWGYFENALSVHIELLYFRTSLVAVQALTVMSYYTQSIGSPCVEYMLCSNAARLAYSKGLHRQPVSSWNLSSAEQCHRNWLFWAIYTLEKNVTTRSGRPSIMNDEETNCQILDVSPPGPPIKISYATSLIQLAQMNSLVATKFASLNNLYQDPEALASIVSELQARHIQVGVPLGDLVNPNIPFDSTKLPDWVNLQQAMYLRIAYFNISLDIHTPLTHPWSHMRQYPALQSQVQESMDIVARTVRAVILSSQFISIDATTPLLLAFYGPMYSLTNLFIHVLQNPDLPTVSSDLALLDIGAGHFARLEFGTDSEVPIVFAKEIATMARAAVKRHKALAWQIPGNLSTYDASGLGPDRNEMEGMGEWGREGGLSTYREGYTTNFFDLDLDHWTTFLPLHDFNDGLSPGAPLDLGLER